MPVLGPPVIADTIQGRGVHGAQQFFAQLFVRAKAGVEYQLDPLGMSS